jgi:hypothetical protein
MKRRAASIDLAGDDDEVDFVEDVTLASLGDGEEPGEEPTPAAVPLENILSESFTGDTLSLLAGLGGAPNSSLTASL